MYFVTLIRSRENISFFDGLFFFVGSIITHNSRNVSSYIYVIEMALDVFYVLNVLMVHMATITIILRQVANISKN